MSAISVAGVAPVVLSGIEKPKTKGVRLTRLIATMLVALVIWYLPNPAGVDIKAWHLFAIFVATILGLILQIGLIVIVVRLAMAWWQRRHAPASAYAGTAPGAAVGPGAQSSFRTGTGFGSGSGSAPLEIGPADYEAFERLLSEIQAAWSNEDVAKLHTLATPEMVSYFTKDLEENKARNDINKVSDVKLLQGDLSEAWREGDTDYASVAMRFSLVDKTPERSSGKLVAGSDAPAEVTEVWTFVRPRGSNWELSAIQQT